MTRMRELAHEVGLPLPSRKKHRLDLGSEYAVPWRDAIAKELQRRLLTRNR
jgi:hypothetical protein